MKGVMNSPLGVVFFILSFEFIFVIPGYKCPLVGDKYFSRNNFLLPAIVW